MSMRDLQFAEPKTGWKTTGVKPARSGSWAVRRAPSWRRAGPKAVVAPVKKTVRAVALDIAAVVVGLGLGLAVIVAITSSGIL